ncbi:TetR/AcrR family transcriptional regulator [Streptomyces caatingaensis]|uniref:TetR family transcriptional regulator n=1 Tax=Streptomyces caatingaensis TaxID=1678637 RepID=A0A0K9XBE9_9ACTN|nr:TetR/AcrR family transcriptional regulator [Streptomyces caatingaensis]KNB50543.1 TetR family transcriptional regulator [Streptomyces caatingaensis]
MPTGVAIRDPRRQLFTAAERVLLRDGPDALTSRAVTTEAGCAKGVLHRHFPDFDAFLAELVRDRVARLDDLAAALRAATGTGTVAGNLTDALTTLFESVAVAIVGLVTSRDGLRARLRAVTPAGIPLLTEATAVLAGYLAAERDAGRLAADADVAVLAPALVGTGHLLFADRTGTPPRAEDVRQAVTAVVAGALRRREERAGP